MEEAGGGRAGGCDEELGVEEAGGGGIFVVEGGGVGCEVLGVGFVEFEVFAELGVVGDVFGEGLLVVVVE